MDDLSICKRIAEICGAEYEKYMLQGGERLTNWNGTTWQNFNPLVDDALCFQLMVEYQIKLSYEYDETWICFKHGLCGQLSKDISPNKAICLAIIEAHKE